MPQYGARVDAVHPYTHAGEALVPVACRYCPGRVNRSARGYHYRADMTGAEWAVIELFLPTIVIHPDDLHAFKVLPRRWVVERTLSWITRHHRTVCDYQRLHTHHQTYIYWPMTVVMTQRLTGQLPTAGRPGSSHPQTRLGSQAGSKGV